MKANRLKDLSSDLSVSCYDVASELKQMKEYVLSDQMLRCGTSVGANISEAQFSVSRADFISRLTVSLKEANEVQYWLGLLIQRNLIIPERHSEILNLTNQIIAMLISSIKTAKFNISREKPM